MGVVVSEGFLHRIHKEKPKEKEKKQKKDKRAVRIYFLDGYACESKKPANCCE